MEVRIEKFSTTCADGIVLNGSLIIPEHPKAVVQFNGGTGTKKEFYQPFLQYLAEHGYLCCLWDYRGSGESAPETLKGCDFTFRDYGIQDMPAIKLFLRNHYPDLPFFLAVHSVGGQQVGFAETLSDVNAMIAFAVSAGYFPNMPPVYRLLSTYFFYIFTPLSNFFAGYVKAKPFGYMENLPKNVVLEWRAWCERKHYFFDARFYRKTVPEGHYQNMPFPIHVFSTSDDTISGPKNIETFWSRIKSEHRITFSSFTPEKLRVKKIGHLGFFKRRFKETVWSEALKQLDFFHNASKN